MCAWALGLGVRHCLSGTARQRKPSRQRSRVTSKPPGTPSLQELTSCQGFRHKPRTPCVCNVATETHRGSGAGCEGLVLEALLPLSSRAFSRELIMLSQSYGVEERNSNEFQMLLFFSFYNWKQKYGMAFKSKVPERNDAFSSGVLAVI